MMSLIFSLFVFIVGGAMSVAVFWAMRRLRQTPASETNKDYANSVAFRIGAIHALVLSLVFTGVLNLFLEVEESLDVEVLALGKLQSLYENSGKDVGVALTREYTQAVLEEGLNREQISIFSASDRILDKLFALALIDLNESVPAAATALELLGTIYDQRTQRVLDVGRSIPVAFWLVGILGFLLTLYAMTVYAPSVFGLEMVFVYGGVVTLVLYLIYELTTPFSNLIHLDAENFHRFLAFHD